MTERHNLSRCARVEPYDLENPFAEGSFRWVTHGRYISGPRKGELCVFKWFKQGTSFQDIFFQQDIKAVYKALEFVEMFNNLCIVDKFVSLNIPEVWTDVSGFCRSNMLVEPFIHNFQKFNSNSGWNDDSNPWFKAMQALSHFSYHISGGQYVLCDLQGGIYPHAVVLTDPVVLSRTMEFGVTDLGPEGISNFFSNHKCNVYCRPYWSVPANQTPRFRPVMGTYMLRRVVPTAKTCTVTVLDLTRG